MLLYTGKICILVFVNIQVFPLRIPTRKPSVQKQKDARKGFSGDAEDQKKLEENLQKKSAEERTKKAASTQSRQLSDLVNYTGEPNAKLQKAI